MEKFKAPINITKQGATKEEISEILVITLQYLMVKEPILFNINIYKGLKLKWITQKLKVSN